MRAITGLLLAAALQVCAQTVELEEIASGLGDVVTDIQQPPGDARLFALTRDGRILILRNNTAATFLDIRDRVTSGGERGLLGLAFPPGFAAKQYFYVNYTAGGRTLISRFRVGADPDRADPASETVLLTIMQPFANHNGGQIRFGPDGFFYTGMGDGGSAGDPMNHAQNPGSLLGKLLRYDSESDLTQFIPAPGNPAEGNPAFDPAVWALGLRNPWRFSWDRATGDFWVADVGQNRAEEINFRPAANLGGENYGWSVMEGLQCFRAGCDPTGFVLPVFEYGRSEGCSVTGGFVYRGPVPALRGQYLYGDFCTARIWGLRPEGNGFVNREWLRAPAGVTTFGEDNQGEVYVGTAGGAVYRLTAGPDSGPVVLSVTNAASFVPGMVAGSIASAFVSGIVETDGSAETIPLPETLAGVSVTVNGRMAPLYGVASSPSGEQVNFQVPFESAGPGPAVVVVRRGAVATAPFEAPLAAAQPGIFTLDGTAAIAVRVEGNRLVTAAEPLAAGELIYFYATGLGAVTNPPATGAASPREPLAHAVVTPSVTVGGVPAEVLFAGLAPDLVGLFQVNLRMPAGVPAGNAEMVIETGGAAGSPVRLPMR